MRCGESIAPPRAGVSVPAEPAAGAGAHLLTLVTCIRSTDCTTTALLVGGAAADSPKHIVRRGVLTRLSPIAQAFLCPCDECADVVVGWLMKKAEQDRLKREFNPPCSFCGLPTIWNGFVFACPYAMPAAQHERIKALTATKQSSNALRAQKEVRTIQGADRSAVRGALLH